jgi:hypothetical protein
MRKNSAYRVIPGVARFMFVEEDTDNGALA